MTTVTYTHTRPYRQQGPWRRPLLPVQLERGAARVRTWGLVDSGADVSLFHVVWSRALGFQLDPAAARHAHLAGGVVEIWWCDVRLVVVGHAIDATVAFSPACDPGYGLLGRADFFRGFRVGFDEFAEEFHLEPVY